MKNGIGKAAKAYTRVLAAIISVMFVVGCGYSSASDDLSTQDAPPLRWTLRI